MMIKINFRILKWFWAFSFCITMPSTIVYIFISLPFDWLRVIYLILLVIALVPSVGLLLKFVEVKKEGEKRMSREVIDFKSLMKAQDELRARRSDLENLLRNEDVETLMAGSAAKALFEVAAFFIDQRKKMIEEIIEAGEEDEMRSKMTVSIVNACIEGLRDRFGLEDVIDVKKKEC